MLGDNIFYGHGLPEMFARAVAARRGATVFGYWVKNPQAYGVAEFDADGQASSASRRSRRSPSRTTP